MLRLLLEGSADLKKGAREYDTLLRLAKKSPTDTIAKVELLLKYKYGSRWLSRHRTSTPKPLASALTTTSIGTSVPIRLSPRTPKGKEHGTYSLLEDRPDQPSERP